MADLKPYVFLDTDLVTGEIPSSDRLQVPSLVSLGDVDLSGNQINNLAAGTAASDAVTFAQLQAATSGLDYKNNVVAVATSNIVLSGLQTIDGVAVADGQRVLLTGQSTVAENGLWLASSGAWTRPTDFLTGSSAEGSVVSVTGGTTYEGTEWVAVADSPNDAVDTDDPEFVQRPNSLSAGNGIDITGSSVSVDLSAVPGLFFNAGQLEVLLKDATLDIDASGLFVQGLPLNFTVDGVATSASLTAANLNTLVTGGDASALHTHDSVRCADKLCEVVLAEEAIAIGQPVEWGTVNDRVRIARADATARIDVFAIAVQAAAAPGDSIEIVRRGVAEGVLTGATVGDRYFLAPTGGLTLTPPTTGNQHVVFVGVAKNATDLEVTPQHITRRAL